MSEAHAHHEAPSIPFEDLPARMKRARDRTGLTQAQIGAILGVHQRTVANWEGAQTEPKIKQLQDWARITNVPEDWLILGIEPCTCGAEAITRSRCFCASCLAGHPERCENRCIDLVDNVVYASFDAVDKSLAESYRSADKADVYEFPHLPFSV